MEGSLALKGVSSPLPDPLPTLTSWFQLNGLSAYTDAFLAAGFDSVHDLYNLNRQDLEKLGVM